MPRKSRKKRKKWRKQQQEQERLKNFTRGETKKETKTDEKSPLLNEVKNEDLGLANLPLEEMEIQCEDLRVILPIQIFRKIIAYTKLMDDEINGIGLVETDGTNFRITEMFLPKQEVGRASCEMDTDGMVKLMDKLIREGKNPSQLRCWWHSHNTMGTNWSTTDEDTGEFFKGSSYLISLVSDQEGTIKARLNLYKPFEMSIENVPIEIEYPLPEEDIVAQCKKDIEESVKVKSYTYYNSNEPRSTYGYGGKTHKNNNFCDKCGRWKEYCICNDNNWCKKCGALKKYCDCDDLEKIKKEGESKVLAKVPEGDFEDEGPLGNFIENGIRYVWKKEFKKYWGYDIWTGRLLTDDELRERSEVDYNDPKWQEV